MADGVIRDMLERSIDELPDELRSVFVARVVDGMTTDQFAELFSLTTETVEAHLRHARNLLVEVLIRRFGPACPESRTSAPSVTADFGPKSTSLNLSSLLVSS